MPVAVLLAHGERLFAANWTEQEGGARPMRKGTGRPLAEPVGALTGARAFNLVSAPDANSCAGCHNAPSGIVGGGGDFVTSVFVLGQRFDAMTFDPSDTLPTRGTVDETGEPATLPDAADLRATTGMFGAGYLEMLARQMTEELQHTRDSIRHGETKELVAKGIHFGKLTLTKNGPWETSKVEGLGRLSLISTGTTNPPTLIIRPWHQASNVVSLREFTNTAFNQHNGIQSTERFGVDTDPDGDGVQNEMFSSHAADAGPCPRGRRWKRDQLLTSTGNPRPVHPSVAASARGQLAGVRDFATADQPNLRRIHGHNGLPSRVMGSTSKG